MNINNETEKVWVFDNEGKTIDRFTIVTIDGKVFTASDEPMHPMGVGNLSHELGAEEDPQGEVLHYLECARTDKSWLGEEVVTIGDLPVGVQLFIRNILSDEVL